MDLPDFFYQFYTKGKRMEQLSSTLFDVFKYICGLTLLKYLHKMSLCVCCDGGLEAPSVGQDAGEVI